MTSYQDIPDWEEEYIAAGLPEQTKIISPPSEGITPLGHDRGVFYYLSRSAQQVFALTADKHTKNNMLAMASMPHYWETYQLFKRQRRDKMGRGYR